MERLAIVLRSSWSASNTKEEEVILTSLTPMKTKLHISSATLKVPMFQTHPAIAKK
jgi:hypothetical protein